jgi:mRNA interferase MazF
MPIERGEIYFVNLNPVQGREQAGQRPVLVLSIDAINRLSLVIIDVVGTKGENISRDYPTNVRISATESGLPLETVFLCFQVRSLDPKRFPDKPAGKVTGATLKKYRECSPIQSRVTRNIR